MKKLFSTLMMAISFTTLSGCAVYETEGNVVYRQRGAVIYETSPNYYIYNNRHPKYVGPPPGHRLPPPQHGHKPPPPGLKPFHPGHRPPPPKVYRQEHHRGDRIPPEYRR